MQTADLVPVVDKADFESWSPSGYSNSDQNRFAWEHSQYPKVGCVFLSQITYFLFICILIFNAGE